MFDNPILYRKICHGFWFVVGSLEASKVFRAQALEFSYLCTKWKIKFFYFNTQIKNPKHGIKCLQVMREKHLMCWIES